MSSDIFINDSGGYRILMKNSNQFATSFSVDFMFKYYPDSSSTPTFPTTDSGWSRLILFAMGGGTANSNKGVMILLERYNGNEYITLVHNSDNTSGWQYMPGFGPGTNGINVSPNNYYHVTLNIFVANGDFELNVIEGPTSNPVPITVTGSDGKIAYQPQAGIGGPNENIDPNQTQFPNIDYDTGSGIIYAYSARNITYNYIRLWDGNIRNESGNVIGNYTPKSLFNLGVSNQIIDVKSDGYPVPTNPYPRNMGTEPTDVTSNYYQNLVFQLNAKSSNSLQDLRNTAYYGDTKNIDGVAPTLTSSPTGYSPLYNYAVNYDLLTGNGPIELIAGANIGGDPHITPLIGKNYDIQTEGKYLYFLYENGNDYIKLYCKIRKFIGYNPVRYVYYNDVATLYEKKGDISYRSVINFNNMDVSTADYVKPIPIYSKLRNNMTKNITNSIKYNNTYRLDKSININVYCLNEKIVIIFNSATKNIYLRVNTQLINKCKGALVSQNTAVKIN